MTPIPGRKAASQGDLRCKPGAFFHPQALSTTNIVRQSFLASHNDVALQFRKGDTDCPKHAWASHRSRYQEVPNLILLRRSAVWPTPDGSRSSTRLHFSAERNFLAAVQAPGEPTSGQSIPKPNARESKKKRMAILCSDDPSNRYCFRTVRIPNCQLRRDSRTT